MTGGGYSDTTSPAKAVGSDPPWVHGDAVQVWSVSRDAWVDGVIEAYFPEAGVFEGFSVPAGAVKVSLGGGTSVKWIMPDVIEKQLRRVTSASRPSLMKAFSCDSSMTSSESVRLCKLGCGRPVQSGHTRSLKSYDTCCKSCVMTNGSGAHDENCGGKKSAAPASDASTSFSPKAQIELWLQNEGEMKKEIDRVLSEGFPGLNKLDLKQAGDALLLLFATLGTSKTLLPKDELMSTMFKAADKNGDGFLDMGEFVSFTHSVLTDRLKAWFPPVLRVSTANFVGQNMRALTDVYTLGQKLGEGSFGIVYSATHIISGEQRVCKRLPKGEAAEAAVALAEIGNMAMLDHPNVIKVYEYFDDGAFISQIMEPCKGGELQDKVAEVRNCRQMDKSSWPYDESFIRSVMKQTLRAIAFMHAQKVVHKDLKPQNVMLVDKVSDSVKVIDFGLAELLSKTSSTATRAGGTLLYMAPEVFKRCLTPKVDIWSAGVILYNLLTGDYPFIGEWRPPPKTDPAFRNYVQVWEQETEKCIVEKPPNMTHPRLKLASSACLEAMWMMIDKDSSKRPDAEQCLAHPWFQDPSCTETPTLSVGVMQNVEAFGRMPEIKKAIFLLIAHQCSVDALREIQALFTHFDVRNRGCLSAEDLRVVLVHGGMGPLTAERVVHTLCMKEPGMVGWTEFMAAAIWVNVSRRPQAIDAAFSTFDPDQSGRALMNDFARVFGGKLDKDAWKEKLPEMMRDILTVIQPADTMSGMKRAIRQSIRLQSQLTKDEFHRYVTSEVAFAGGDALFAVS
eukprot:TRINITY_DN10665_c0_g1_i1.p1 TRINITY_DN10665_c0_g1~~TRINITY_DN10665_c0_g1_i1.p1  ORF type:complete len:788 (-),score=136.17 TRINITY_DN10665_c0_g1_i1:54-2417(-)